MTDKKKKNVSVDWEFDFKDIGDRIQEMFNSFKGSKDDVDMEVKEAHFSEPLNAVKHAVVAVDFSLGEAIVSALDADSENLFEADLVYMGDVEFHTNGDANRVVTLKQVSGMSFSRNMRTPEKLVWRIRINPTVPVTLRMKGGVGALDINLHGMRIDYVEYKGGVGKTDLTLPQSAGALTGNFATGVGEMNVIIPQATAANLTLNGGVGAINVTVPVDAALNINGRIGVGDINVPDSLESLSGKRVMFTQRGVWQSVGFAESSHPITINYRGGLGALRVQEMAVV